MTRLNADGTIVVQGDRLLLSLKAEAAPTLADRRSLPMANFP